MVYCVYMYVVYLIVLTVTLPVVLLCSLLNFPFEHPSTVMTSLRVSTYFMFCAMVFSHLHHLSAFAVWSSSGLWHCQLWREERVRPSPCFTL